MRIKNIMKFSRNSLLDIALIFEQANGNVLNDSDSLLIKESGLTEHSPEELESLLINSIKESESEYRGTVYWVLGKRFNNTLIPIFNEWLEFELSLSEDNSIFQILIALDNMETQVFGEDRNDGFSVMETKLNQRDARAYLNKIA